jgi:two-component system response regulator DevR
VRVLVVDDHRAMRRGIKTLLSASEGIEVAGEAACPAEALEQTRELRPDLVILDLRMQRELSGIEVCREIKGIPEPPRVLVYSDYNSARELAAVTLAGADGYLHKGEESADLAEVVRRVYAGERVWISGISGEEARSRLESEASGGALTRREREVLTLMTRRYGNAEIAKELRISVPTVKTHVRHILQKLGVERRRDLF